VRTLPLYITSPRPQKRPDELADLPLSSAEHPTSYAELIDRLSLEPPRDTSDEVIPAEERVARILALVDDMIFQAKMLETAKHLGLELKSFATGEALLEELDREQPKLVIVDLNAHHAPLEKVAGLRAGDPEIPIIAFFSHVQTDLGIRARDAGCTEVMPRSKFTKLLAAILLRAQS
jgi:CheY-like chemotaxis protein